MGRSPRWTHIKTTCGDARLKALGEVDAEQHKIDQMKEEVSMFSKTLNKDHLDAALKMKTSMEDNEQLDLREQL